MAIETTASLKELLADTAAALPVPRLQLVWTDDEPEEDERGFEWFVSRCHYLMVFPVDRWDIRNMADCHDESAKPFTAVRMGETRVRGGPQPATLIETPYRDGCHAKWDAKTFGGFPVFVSRGKEWRPVEADDKA